MLRLRQRHQEHALIAAAGFEPPLRLRERVRRAVEMLGELALQDGLPILARAIWDVLGLETFFRDIGQDQEQAGSMLLQVITERRQSGLIGGETGLMQHGAAMHPVSGQARVVEEEDAALRHVQIFSLEIVS